MTATNRYAARRPWGRRALWFRFPAAAGKGPDRNRAGEGRAGTPILTGHTVRESDAATINAAVATLAVQACCHLPAHVRERAGVRGGAARARTCIARPAVI